MCRFLLVRSKEKIKPEKLLNQFSSMCEKSHAPEGDWQGDGWGISIKNEKWQMQNAKWNVYKSLKPIWQDKNTFSKFPETNIFLVHARSAGFPDQKGIIEYNQPYVSDDLSFVFNGMIKGVNLKRKLEGKIGAQRIFSLIKEERRDKSLDTVLRFVDKLMHENSQRLIGMNIGVTNSEKFFILCEYENSSSYFGIKYYQDDSITLVCSAPIGSYEWKIMKKGEIMVL